MRTSRRPSPVGLLVGLALVLGIAVAACGDHTDGGTNVGPNEPTLPAERVRAVVDSYVTAFNTRDRELYVSLFADDGTVEDPVGTKPVAGHEALATFFDSVTSQGRLVLELLPDGVRPSGNHVAFYFRLRLEVGGATLGMNVIDTFDLDPTGRIRAMRAYWSPSDLRPVG